MSSPVVPLSRVKVKPHHLQTAGSYREPSFGSRVKVRHVTDDYRFLEELGTGAFSVVRKAVRKTDELTVAVKCVDRTKLSHSERDNLKREIEIIQEILHVSLPDRCLTA